MQIPILIPFFLAYLPQFHYLSPMIFAKQFVSEDELANLPFPEVEEGERYRPIHYDTQVKLARASLEKHGYKITEKEFGLARPAILRKGRKDEPDKFIGIKYSELKDGTHERTRKNQRVWWLHFFGGFRLSHDLIEGKRKNLVFGMRGSCNKSLAASFVVGSQMIVCDNLDFSSEIKLSRRNTKNAEQDLPSLIDDAVSRIMEEWAQIEARSQAYKGHELTEEQALKQIAHFVDIESLPKQKMYDVLGLFRNPAARASDMVNQEEFSEAEYDTAVSEKKEEFVEEFGKPLSDDLKTGSVWRLYNALTFVLKGSSLDCLPNRTMQAQLALDGLVGFERTVSQDLNEVDATPEEQQEEMQESFGEESPEE